VESHILASEVCANFPKSVSNLVKSPVVNMESDSDRNVDRTELFSESGSVPAPREDDPTAAVSRPGAAPVSAMVTRSRAREGRVNVVRETEFPPGVEFRPEVEFRQEMEIPPACEGGLGAARPFTTDITSQYVIADKPEMTVRQEVTTCLSSSGNIPNQRPFHTLAQPPPVQYITLSELAHRSR